MVRERERMGSMSLPPSLFLLLEHMWELQGPFINDVSREGKGVSQILTKGREVASIGTDRGARGQNPKK